MLRILFIILLTYAPVAFQAQDWINESKEQLKNVTNDRERLLANNSVFYAYVYNYPDSALPYARQNMIIARKLNTDSALAVAYHELSLHAVLIGNHPLGLEYIFEALKYAESSRYPLLMGDIYIGSAEVYLAQGDFKKAIFYCEKKKAILESYLNHPIPYPAGENDTLISYYTCLYKLSETYERMGQLDSALLYIKKVELGWSALPVMWPTTPYTYGKIYSRMADQAKAIGYYHQGIQNALQIGVKKDLMDIFLAMGFAQMHSNRLDSSIYYGNKVLETGKKVKFPLTELKAVELLATVYKTANNLDSALRYFELALAMNDSLFSQEKLSQMQSLEFNEQLRQQEMEDELQKRTYQYRLYTLIGGILVVTVIAIILYRSNRHKQQAKVSIEKAYTELKATQAQLIQSEKMASLGELTAGIAHEIQNPLNFMNNFSDVNKDLLLELKEEIDKGNFDDVKLIADDLINNEEKINHHGKRADSIVKGMLQHSRKSTGEKELTDINALADEYLRLAFHGMRARDKSFNATLKTDFDPSIGKINLVSQDIARVLLNLYNNAFQSVVEKAKTNTTYNPEVFVSTSRMNGQLNITVKDNGVGISEKVISKIFQPFFTTKPTGQGTGLGLSLAYDIVNAHGGKIEVRSAEGQGSEFQITLIADS